MMILSKQRFNFSFFQVGLVSIASVHKIVYFHQFSVGVVVILCFLKSYSLTFMQEFL